MRNLLDFLYKYHHWLVFVLLEVVSVVLLFQYNSYQGSVWFSSANAMAGKVYELESTMTSYMGMRELNEQLTLRNMYQERQLDQLRRLYAEATKDTTDMQRKELEFLSHYQLISAKVVENSIHKAENLITIDKGRKDGVEPDMGVACGNGVVGVVYLVSDHYSCRIRFVAHQLQYPQSRLLRLSALVWWRSVSGLCRGCATPCQVQTGRVDGDQWILVDLPVRRACG